MKKMRNFITAGRIIVVGMLFVLGLLIYSDSALAQIGYNSLVKIPGVPSNVGVTTYLSGLYNFLTGVVGIVAMGAIIIGGVRYMTSAGNPSAAEDAKHTISSAIFGLILALASWMIIREINMDILVLRNPSMPFVPTGYTDTASNSYNCALPGGDGSAASPCYCVDNPTKPIVVPNTPRVIATVPGPCLKNVPTTLSYAIQIKYSDIMDPATVGTATAFTFSPAITISSINTNNTGNSTSVAINLSASLANNTEYTVTVKKGAGLNERLSDHITLAADYVYKFTTGAAFATSCYVPASGSFCQTVCSDPALSGDNTYHCGWEFLKIKTDTKSATAAGNYYTLSSSAELWNFGLTNKGNGYGPLNFSVDATEYVNGPDTYNCAILLENADIVPYTYAFYIFWVKEGIEIRANGSSLRADIIKSASEKGIANPYVGGCNLLAGGAFGTEPQILPPLPTNCCGSEVCMKTLWNAHYTDNPIIDKCGDCSFSSSNTQFRPAYDIICAKDYTGHVVWRKK